MGPFIRVVNPQHDYDPTDGTLTDLALKPRPDAYGKPTVSCFSEPCSIAASGSACEHIAEHYADITSNPGVFWRFELFDIPGCNVTQVTERGDHCHHHLYGISKKQWRDIRKGITVDSLCVCAPTGLVKATKEDLACLRAVSIAASSQPTPATPDGSKPPR